MAKVTPPAGKTLCVFEIPNVTILGYADVEALSQKGAQATAVMAEPVRVERPVRVVQGMRPGPAGPEKVFNTYPMSMLDFVEVVHVYPNIVFEAGPETTKVHTDTWQSFVDEYEQYKAAGAGVVLATSTEMAAIERERQRQNRH